MPITNFLVIYIDALAELTLFRKLKVSDRKRGLLTAVSCENLLSFTKAIIF